MTDREVMMAIFDALAQIFTHITGKELVVNIQTENGLITINGSHKFGETRPAR